MAPRPRFLDRLATSTLGTAPQAVLTQATGDLQLANSRDGQAIFKASGLAPGRSVMGTVRLVKLVAAGWGDVTLHKKVSVKRRAHAVRHRR